MTERHAGSSTRRRVVIGLLAALAAVLVLASVVLALRPPTGPPRSAPTTAPAPATPPASPGTPSAGPRGPVTPTVTPVTIAAVGDMSCDPSLADEDGDGRGPRQCQMQAVSDLLVKRRPAALLALGDLQYTSGRLEAFRTRYAPTFGRLRSITYPVPGNHEYGTPHAAGYFAYFGARAGSPQRGYYSFDMAGWHVVALNSNCSEVSCSPGSAQERWLRGDLAAHPSTCTLAYWHHPRWSHGEHGNNDEVQPFVQALTDAKADVILAGHDHDYERYTPRAASGQADPQGIREFVVGTGGRNIRSADGGEGTEAFDSDSFGALYLSLTPTGYSWQFRSVGGASFTDTGSATCV